MSSGQIVAGWVAPHGVVPDMPEEHLSNARATDAAMRTAAERMVALGIEAVALVAPHGFRAADANTVSLCRSNAVGLAKWYPWRDDELRFDGDVELAALILDAAHESNLSAVGLIYGGTSESVYPMDWSITAPMRYLQDAGYTGTLVPVTFSQQAFDSEWKFGRAIAKAAAESGKRLGLIASSDLSHVHSANGPYGFDPIAPVFDATIERAVRENDIQVLMDLDPEWVQQAAQDGLRSILILGGSIEGREFASEVLSYDVMVYFGMLSAWFG